VIATRARDGSPARALVDVVPFADASGRRRRIHGITDGRGEASFAAVPGGPVKVFAADVCRYSTLDPGRDNVVEMEIPPAPDALVLVSGESGAPLPPSGSRAPARAIAGRSSE
jgi:hypothetical protein